MMDERDIVRDDIARWLREATEGLPPEECDRVCESLLDHYAEVLDKDRAWSSSGALMDLVYGQVLAALNPDEQRAAQLHPALRGWLDAATDGLCAGARERVALEVSAHFLDALQEARGKGLDGMSAREHAVRSLGNPRTARRMYRQSFLTAGEEERIANLLGIAASSWRRIAVTVSLGNMLVLLCLLARRRADALSEVIVPGAAVVFALYLVSVLVLTPLLRRARQWRYALTLNFVIQILFLSEVGASYRAWPGISGGFVANGVSVVIVWSAYDFVCLYRKLGNEYSPPVHSEERADKS